MKANFDSFMEDLEIFFREHQRLMNFLKSLAQRMAAAQAMMNSMTPEQQQQLQQLSDQLLEDMDLQWQMDQLSQHLRDVWILVGSNHAIFRG